MPIPGIRLEWLARTLHHKAWLTAQLPASLALGPLVPGLALRTPLLRLGRLSSTQQHLRPTCACRAARCTFGPFSTARGLLGLSHAVTQALLPSELFYLVFDAQGCRPLREGSEHHTHRPGASAARRFRAPRSLTVVLSQAAFEVRRDTNVGAQPPGRKQHVDQPSSTKPAGRSLGLAAQCGGHLRRSL